jgi:hypothetical protein
VDSGWHGYTRVATNRITSAGGSEDVTVRITSVFGKRQASVSTTEIEGTSLENAVRESERLARLAPESPERMPELGEGEFLRQQLSEWLDPGLYPPERHEFILDMMQDPEIGLCFRLPTPREERYLVPKGCRRTAAFLADGQRTPCASAIPTSICRQV